MTTIVEFLDAHNEPAGQVTVTDTGELQPDPWLHSVTDAWLAQGRPAAEFAKHYDGWSNGYTSARIRGKDGTDVATTPKLGSGTRFKKLAARLAASGADKPDAPAGQKKPGARFGRLAAKSKKSE